MPAKTGAKGAAPKKTTRTTSKAGGAKKAKQAPPPPPPRRNLTPLFIIVIMLLLTVIAVLLKGRFTGEQTAAGRGKVRHEARRAAERSESGREEKDEGKLPSDASQKKTDTKETAGAAEKDVRIYLVRFDERTEKTSMVPVTRKIKAADPVEAAIRALIAGPTETEKRRGLLTAVPARLKLRDAQVRQKTAVLDFSGEIEQNASGSILLSRIDQIVYTATQFDGVESVLIRINGKSRSVIGSDGLAIGAPLRRK